MCVYFNNKHCEFHTDCEIRVKRQLLKRIENINVNFIQKIIII